jgi:intracellular multiplication protein IcmB
MTSFVEKIHNNIDALFAWVGSALKQEARAYCDLEAVDSKFVLVNKDGSLTSIIRLDGFKRFVGGNEFAFLCQRMAEIFQPVFSGSGHYLEFCFSYDRAKASEIIEDTLLPARRTAVRLGLDIKDIFDSRVQTLSRFCAQEECFIVLWTLPGALTTAHLKQAQKAEQRRQQAAKLPQIKGAQNLSLVLSEIRNIHDSFVTSVMEDLQHTGFYCELLEAHRALYHVRDSIDPDFMDRTWLPYLPGDKLPIHYDPLESTYDLGDLLWPPLDQQLIVREAENIDMKLVRIGDRVYAPMFIELFPKDIKPFYELFRRLLSSEIPWRIAYYVGPAGIKIAQSKNMLAQILAFTAQHNKLIVEANKLLKQINDRSDDPVISFSICMATWGPATNIELVKERASKLAKAVQSWGGAEVREMVGDPYGLTLSSAVGVSKRQYSSATAAPLSDAIAMMPFVRPASPWTHGALSFRTPDGKIWPFQPGSSHQICWIDIIYARSGSGKSVLLSTLNLGLVLSNGLSKLPRISIIDIGPSSKGFISLLQEGLAESEKYLVRYYRLKMDESDAINPFDTQIGARFPTKIHRAFLVNFISLLLVDSLEDRPYEGMTSMISMIIDETYRSFSDQGQPKTYTPHSHPQIQSALEAMKFKVEPSTTWWNVTDAFFRAGEHRLALKSQRLAAPTIADTIAMAHVHTIKDLFSEVKTPAGESFVSAYCRIMAGVVRNFPTLTCSTRLELGDSRIVALDLDEVAKSGGGAADKQTAVMYMLARHVLAQNFFLNTDEVDKWPLLYQDFHRKRIKEIMEEPKRMVFDEFHRTSKSPVIRDQILQDMREGRKWKIHVALSSQSLTDFDALMMEFATSVFILDSGSSISVDQTVKAFGLTETEKLALTTRVHGPTSKGSTFIAQFVTKKGLNTQLLTSTISPVELWAFNTTTEDVMIRDRLYAEIGPVNARFYLAQKFPQGSATTEIEMELKTNSTQTVGEICDRIVKDVIVQYRRNRRQKELDDDDSSGDNS